LEVLHMKFITTTMYKEDLNVENKINVQGSSVNIMTELWTG